jgi:hypothetical protein
MPQERATFAGKVTLRSTLADGSSRRARHRYQILLDLPKPPTSRVRTAPSYQRALDTRRPKTQLAAPAEELHWKNVAGFLKIAIKEA